MMSSGAMAISNHRIVGGGEKRLRVGKGEKKRGTGGEFVLGGDRPAMGEDDMFRDGEAEAGASGLARAGFIHAIETLEEARQMFGGDAGAEILHIKFDAEFDSPLPSPRCRATPQTDPPPRPAAF